jgi:hypothetical protein
MYALHKTLESGFRVSQYPQTMGLYREYSFVQPSTLPQVPTSQQSTIRSQRVRTTPTLLKFLNLSRDPIATYWINWDGEDVYYTTIPSGGEYHQPTYVGHPWIVANGETGAELGVWNPMEGYYQVVIGNQLAT